MNKSLSVLVLAYNEEKTIVRCVDEVIYACRDLPDGYEVIIVNDASTDRTLELAQELVAKYPAVRLISNVVNRGYGGAFKTGLAEAKKSYLTVVGAVNAINRESLREIYARVGEKDMILSYIANPEVRSWQRRIISYLYTKCIDLLSGYRLKYYNSGCNIFPTHKVQEVEFTDGHSFFAEILLTFLDEGLSYIMIPMVLNRREVEHSSALRWKNIVAVSYTFWGIFLTQRLKIRGVKTHQVKIDELKGVEIK